MGKVTHEVDCGSRKATLRELQTLYLAKDHDLGEFILGLSVCRVNHV